MSRREVGGSEDIAGYPFPSINHLIPEVVLLAIGFEHASLGVNCLHLQKGRIAFYIDFQNLAVDALTASTYLEP